VLDRLWELLAEDAAPVIYQEAQGALGAVRGECVALVNTLLGYGLPAASVPEIPPLEDFVPETATALVRRRPRRVAHCFRCAPKGRRVPRIAVKSQAGMVPELLPYLNPARSMGLSAAQVRTAAAHDCTTRQHRIEAAATYDRHAPQEDAVSC